jgi:cytochrome c
MTARGNTVVRHALSGVAAATVALGLALSGMVSAHAQMGSVPQGKQLFESRCIGCHSLDANRVGPALGTVLGRIAGKANGFDYSNALRAATHVWDAPRLKAWLTNPEALVPGQAMGYRVDAASDRDDLVAYLASLHPVAAQNPGKALSPN